MVNGRSNCNRPQQHPPEQRHHSEGMTAQVDMETSVHMVTDPHGAPWVTSMKKPRLITWLSISNPVRLIGIDHAEFTFNVIDF